MERAIKEDVMQYKPNARFKYIPLEANDTGTKQLEWLSKGWASAHLDMTTLTWRMVHVDDVQLITPQEARCLAHP